MHLFAYHEHEEANYLLDFRSLLPSYSSATSDAAVIIFMMSEFLSVDAITGEKISARIVRHKE
jgi:hypothetical protein